MVTKKRALTLVEILVVMALVGIIVAATSFKAGSLFKERRFEGSSRRLIEKIHTAKNLANLLRANVTVTLEEPQAERAGPITCFLSAQGLPTTGIQKFLKNKEELPEVVEIRCSGNKEDFPLKITFTPYGSCHLEGSSGICCTELQLISSLRNSTPTTIALIDSIPPNVANESKALYPTEVITAPQQTQK
ncbi:MAG TPA: prepilin-type N-terminal cleavage/methylation domain-containing protein [Chlamydiales bacterium]|nr:prepilin-type N-terminal cleavage/methylation domain-containing protein [Chlamydiales bacterium]